MNEPPSIGRYSVDYKVRLPHIFSGFLGLYVFITFRWPCDIINNGCWNFWNLMTLRVLIMIPPHTLQWRHNEHDGVSNHQPHDCLFNRLFMCISKETSRLRVTGLCEENSPLNSPHKGPVTWKMLPFDDLIMNIHTTPSHHGVSLSRISGRQSQRLMFNCHAPAIYRNVTIWSALR